MAARLVFSPGNVRFRRLIRNTLDHGPVASKHSNRILLLYAGSMAYLGRTTGQHRHRVGKGGGGGGRNRGGANTGDWKDVDQRDRERKRNGGGRGGQVGGKEMDQEKIKTVGGVP